MIGEIRGNPVAVACCLIVIFVAAVAGFSQSQALDGQIEARWLIVSADRQQARPGTWIVRFLSMTNWPDVRVIVPVTLKLTVSPGAASAIACRRLPEPLSLVLVTVIVAALAAIHNRKNRQSVVNK